MQSLTRGGSRLEAVACAAALATGAWTLECWRMGRPDLAGIVPGMPPMLPAVASWLVLSGATLALASGTSMQRRAAKALSALGLLMGIGLLLLHVVPNHGILVPNPLTLLSMCLISSALVLRDLPWRQEHDPAGSLALSAMIAPYFAVMGHLLQLTALYRPYNAHGMALPTAMVLILLALGVLASRPERGWMARWNKESPGGSLLRRQVPAVLVTPLVFGTLALVGERANLYPHDMTIGLFLVASGLAGVAHTLLTSRSLDDLEGARLMAVRDLQGSEAMFRGLMEGASDAILVIDELGRIAFKNRQVATVFGFEPGELIGKHLDHLIPERFRSAHAGYQAAYMEAPRRMGMNANRELFARRKDGSEFPAEISLSPVETVEGRFVMVLIRDLTERRRAAEAIAQLNSQLQIRNEEIEAEIRVRTQELAQQKDLAERVNNHVPAGIAFVDTDLVLAWANPEYCRQLGIGLEQLVGVSLAEVMPGLEMEGLLHLEALNAGLPIRLSGAPLTAASEQETTYWDASLVPLFENGSYQGFVILANEVTARIQLEHMQRDHIEALERADALKDEFLNIVSHELRTPIAILSGTLSLLEYEVDGPLSASQRRDVARLRESTDHLLTLVNDLLDMSMIHAEKLTIVPKWIQVGDLIEGAIDFVQPLANERRITIRTELAPDLPVLHADGQRIRQVIINLVSNALKYSPSGSEVAIRVRPEGSDLRCEVADQGPGVPLEDQERIFEKFTRVAASASVDGAGLGLYICQAMVSAHQGAIGVVSDGKAGSTFWFTLPMTK